MAARAAGPSAGFLFFLVGPEQLEMQLRINSKVMIYMAGDTGKQIILGRGMRWDVFTACLGKLSTPRCQPCVCVENAYVQNSI